MLDLGVICLWYGSIANIPAGWALCNGAGGTPDLRDKFIVGAGSTYAVDETGGAASHTHDFTGGGHYHTIPEGSGIGAGTDFAAQTSTDPAAGTTDNGSSLPPYHSLAYIMRI